MTVQSAICVTLSDITSDMLSDITSDMLYKNPAPCAKIGLLETMIAWNGASRYADRKIVTGTLQEVIDTTEAFLNRYIADG